jgi:anti-sigma regulatory factor (Ser/Thr protein kinase)
LRAAVTAPAQARAFARATCAEGRATGHLDDVTLVVSELVTNAVLHGRGDVTLDVFVDDLAVRVEVGDDGPTLARPHAAAPDGESGRGLLMVSRLALRWGVRRDGGGKVVWADVRS